MTPYCIAYNLILVLCRVNNTIFESNVYFVIKILILKSNFTTMTGCISGYLESCRYQVGQQSFVYGCSMERCSIHLSLQRTRSNETIKKRDFWTLTNTIPRRSGTVYKCLDLLAYTFSRNKRLIPCNSVK